MLPPVSAKDLADLCRVDGGLARQLAQRPVRKEPQVAAAGVLAMTDQPDRGVAETGCRQGGANGAHHCSCPARFVVVVTQGDQRQAGTLVFGECGLDQLAAFGEALRIFR